MTSQYPIIDHRFTAGPLPHTYAVLFHDDSLRMDVQKSPTTWLTGCDMEVGLASHVALAKEIAGLHLSNGEVSSVKTSGANLGPNFMLLKRAVGNSGAHTLLFKKAGFGGLMTDMYTLDVNTFWPILGGTRITFTWELDNAGSLKWGHETTWAPSGADGRVVKGKTDPKVFVLQGGAKFWIPSPAVFEAMGFDWANVWTVPTDRSLRFRRSRATTRFSRSGAATPCT